MAITQLPSLSLPALALTVVRWAYAAAGIYLILLNNLALSVSIKPVSFPSLRKLRPREVKWPASSLTANAVREQSCFFKPRHLDTKNNNSKTTTTKPPYLVALHLTSRLASYLREVEPPFSWVSQKALQFPEASQRIFISLCNHPTSQFQEVETYFEQPVSCGEILQMGVVAEAKNQPGVVVFKWEDESLISKCNLAASTFLNAPAPFHPGVEKGGCFPPTPTSRPDQPSISKLYASFFGHEVSIFFPLALDDLRCSVGKCFYKARCFIQSSIRFLYPHDHLEKRKKKQSGTGLQNCKP